ncbi:hypothetical protein AVEN_14775-1 [Araneus ventricosus]|uniref:Tc1-like transposase DDE domain-containing protein n=1 Tax=Araneus ventricosus TaxID=182803 RepID=A0A4Y2UAK6_ARAVE|nr:hypothetical protein AVEN_14775-1 [Araneus ventricosus]
MDDNARPHCSRLVDYFLSDEGIFRMDWPAHSPNLNPIEHVWDILGRTDAGRLSQPETIPQLQSYFLQEREKIPQSLIDNLIDSMPQRCATLLSVRGNHTSDA